MNVLFVTEFFPTTKDADVRGGVEVRSFYLAKHLVKRGHRVTIFATHESGQPRNAKVAGVHVIRLGKTRRFGQRGSALARMSFVREATRLGLDIEADVVDGHSFLGYVPAWHIARRKTVPAIATYHDVWLGEWKKHVGVFSEWPVYELWEHYVLSRPWDHFIANSKTTKAKLIERANIRLERITVVPNGVELTEYRSIKAKKFPRPTICYAGRLVTYKNVDVLLRAAAQLKKGIPDLQVLIIGSGPTRGESETLVRELGMERTVKFLGFLPRHKDVLHVIKQSHVFCFPSSVEGFGIAVLEAMAMGTPYVASDIPPIREATGGEGGILVTPGDVAEFTNAIRHVLREKEPYPDTTSWVAQFDWSRLARRLESVYKALV